MHTDPHHSTEFRRRALPAVLFIALVSWSFADRPNWSVPPPPRVWTQIEIPQGRAFIGAIESQLTVQKGDPLLVYGWAAASTARVRVAEIEIRIDGEAVAKTTDFIPRPDIAGSFRKAGLEAIGWQCVLPVKNLPAGDHQFELHVLGSDGNAEVVLTKTLGVVI